MRIPKQTVRSTIKTCQNCYKEWSCTNQIYYANWFGGRLWICEICLGFASIALSKYLDDIAIEKGLGKHLSH